MIEKIYCKDCFFFSLVEGTLKEDCQYSINDLKKAGFKRRQVSDYADGHGQCHRYPPVLKPHEDYMHYEFHNEISNNFVFVSFEDWCGEGKRATKKKKKHSSIFISMVAYVL